jgi:Ca2+:H+ antiporter
LPHQQLYFSFSRIAFVIVIIIILLTQITIVNHFNIKRQAHNLSRTSTDQSWNPFRHVAWNRRARTFSEAGLEGQQRNRDQTTGEELTHAVTEPGRSGPAREWSTAETMMDTRRSKEDGYDQEKAVGGGSPINGSDDIPTSQRSLVGDENQLRNRKREDVPAAADQNVDLEKRKLDRRQSSKLFRHVEPKEPFTVRNQLERTFLNSYINILLIAAPVGIALNYIHSVNRIAVFVVNFIAIIPLAAILSFATEEIALRTGEVLGGLINATFGNAVELIVAILALVDGKVIIVQTSLVGSILSNLLLVLGFCFFFGGLRREAQYFNETVAQTAARPVGESWLNEHFANKIL